MRAAERVGNDCPLDEGGRDLAGCTWTARDFVDSVTAAECGHAVTDVTRRVLIWSP